MAAASSSSSPSTTLCLRKHDTTFLCHRIVTLCNSGKLKRSSFPSSPSSGRVLRVVCATEGSAKPKEVDETVPSWAKPDADEPPPWARNEGGGGKDGSAEQGFEIPFYVYLLSSAITAIAAIGSAFEYVNQKPVFGVLNSDSVFYAPLLGFFVFTGIPTSGFLWYKSVQTANKEAEEQDKRDGYM